MHTVQQACESLNYTTDSAAALTRKQLKLLNINDHSIANYTDDSTGNNDTRVRNSLTFDAATHACPLRTPGISNKRVEKIAPTRACSRENNRHAMI